MVREAQLISWLATAPGSKAATYGCTLAWKTRSCGRLFTASVQGFLADTQMPAWLVRIKDRGKLGSIK